MNTKEAMDRLAKRGVVVPGLVLTRVWTPEQKRTWDLARVRSRIEANVDTTPPTPSDALGLMTMCINNGVPESALAAISDDHAAMLLEAKWHRKWPHCTCECNGIDGTWFVWDSDAACRRDDGNMGHADNYVCAYGKAKTRLEAMVLAAEQAAKEDRTNG